VAEYDHKQKHIHPVNSKIKKAKSRPDNKVMQEMGRSKLFDASFSVLLLSFEKR
jgi:hypothetical protein